jgi:hypothetical protein
MQLFLSTPRRRAGGAEVHLHSFLTSAPDGDEWSPSRPGRLTSQKEPWYALKKRLGGSQSRSGRFGEEKSLASTLMRTPNRPARSLVSTPTTLSRPAQERIGKITSKFDMSTGELKITSQCATGIPSEVLCIQIGFPGLF